MSYKDLAAEQYLRSALKKVAKAGRQICQGSCGTYDVCGGVFTHGVAAHLPKTTRVCPLCALLLGENLPTSASGERSLLEDRAASYLDVTRDWVVCMLQGFDGDELSNEDRTAYRIGQKLWKEFGR